MFAKHPKRLSRLLLGGELKEHQKKAIVINSEYNLLSGVAKQLGVGEKIFDFPISKTNAFVKIYDISIRKQQREADKIKSEGRNLKNKLGNVRRR